MRKNLSNLAGYLTHRDLGDSEKTNEQAIEAVATAKETTSNLKRENFRSDNAMVQHLINSSLEYKRLMTYLLKLHWEIYVL